jgi:MFS family permease
MTQTSQAARPLAEAPMTWRQGLAVAICVALNALDGFDVLSISFASPGIAREWAINARVLGAVLSFELVGMVFGSIVLGQAADRLGRRKTVLLALGIMTLGMAATSQVQALWQLTATRLFTGFGIGGMLAVTNAMAAEYSNARWRHTAVAVMAAGYPVGGIAGGALAAMVLDGGVWRDVFLLGVGMTLLLLPLVLLFLPEPPAALLVPGRKVTLPQLNAALARLGQARLAALPPVPPAAPRTGLAALFSRELRWVTLLLTLAYFAHILTFYFILKWAPKVVVDMGYTPSAAAKVLMWANVGGLTGGLSLSVLARFWPLRWLLAGFMLASCAMVANFGQPHAGLDGLSWAAAMGGFCTNAGMVGLYALTASSFPAGVRAGGTGLVIGIGRAGAAVGPVLGGVLFAAGYSLAQVAALMGVGALVAAASVLAIGRLRQGLAG